MANLGWTLFKVTSSTRTWDYLIAKEDIIVLKLTLEQAKELKKLLDQEFPPHSSATYDRT